MNFDFDLHIHTHHSPCGKDEMVPSEIVRLAAERGMKRIAITDHWYPNSQMSDIDDTREAIAEAQQRLGTNLKVSFGCEAEIMSPGVTSGSSELAEQFDFVMVGATHFTNKPMTMLPDGDDEFRARYFLEMFTFGVSQPWVDVMAHPFNIMSNVCSVGIFEYLSDNLLIPAIEVARRNDVAMEISRRVFTSTEQYKFLINFYGLCKEAGVKFTLGSDAHELKDLARVSLLRPVISELRLTRDDFWLPRTESRVLAAAG